LPGIDAENRVAHRIDRRRVGSGPNGVDKGLKAFRETGEEDINAKRVEVKIERLQLAVLSLDLVDPCVHIFPTAVVNEATAKSESVLGV
jgi:hypothetical protein